MAEPRDDKVSAAWRAMPPAEPPPALDDAIRAAARRALQAGPTSARRRWALPVSVAAVLALSVGIALNVERERPAVVDGTPVSSGNAEYPVAQEPVEPAAKSPAPQAAPAAKPAAPQAPVATGAARQADAVAPSAFLSEEPPRSIPAPTPMPMPKATTAEPMPAVREAKGENAAASGALVQPPATGFAPPPAAASAPVPAPALRAADRARDEMAPMRAPREAGAAGVTRERAAPSPDKQLERIAELRAAGRDGEADEALAGFRREHPDYRIPPTMWEKVKPR